MGTALYLRISEDKSGEALGIERQENDARALAALRRWPVDRVYSDNDRSATSGKARPDVEQLLRDIAAGHVTRLIVWHLDRLTRTMSDLTRVIEVGQKNALHIASVHGISLDLSDPTGVAVAQIITAIAGMEGSHKASRQRAANRQRAERGISTWSRRPYGFERQGHAVQVVDSEARIIREAATRLLGGETIAGVVRDLNMRDVRTSTGGSWSQTTLRRVLLNPRLAGRVVYRGEDFGDGHPRILEVEEADRLHATLTDPARRTAPSTRTKYLLSGLAICGQCGAAMFATTNIAGSGRRSMVLRCKGCSLTRLYAPTEEYVVAVVTERLSRPDASNLLVGDETLAALQAEAVALRHRLDTLAELLADGILSPSAVREQGTRLKASLDAVVRQVQSQSGHSPLSAVVDAPHPAEAFLAAPLPQQRTVLSALIQVTILPVGKGSRWSPKGIQIDPRQAHSEIT